MAGPKRTITIDATGVYPLGEAEGSRVSTWSIQIVDASFSGSVRVVGGAISSGVAAVPIGYKNRATEAVATAAITTDAFIQVDSAGTDVAIECTSYTSGELTAYCIPRPG